MCQTRVVILSGQSLFTEGIASRLRQLSEKVEVTIVDPEGDDAMAEIDALQPAVVILDATDKKPLRVCPLSALLWASWTPKILRLDSQQEYVQIVTSEQHSADAVRDLLRYITPDSPSQNNPTSNHSV